MFGKRSWFRFSPGNADGGLADLARLGQKGAYLCEMARRGYPVPPGFVIPADRIKTDRRLDRVVREGLAWLTEDVGRSAASSNEIAAPFLVSVRSSSPVSVPGLAEPVLNIGLSPEHLRQASDDSAAELLLSDCYARYLVSLLAALDDRGDGEQRAASEARAELQRLRAAGAVAALHAKCREHERTLTSLMGCEPPSDFESQVRLAVRLARAGWSRERPQAFLRRRGMGGLKGMAVVVQRMVFGNFGTGSGAGCAFSRSPRDGTGGLYGEYKAGGQGVDALDGSGVDCGVLAAARPEVYGRLVDLAARLERDFRDLQDFEFTVQGGEVYVLQTRPAVRCAAAAVRVACDLHDAGLLPPDEAAGRVTEAHIAELRRPVFNAARPASIRPASRGVPASPGAGTGGACFAFRECVRRATAGERVVLVLTRSEAAADADPRAATDAVKLAQGLITADGGMTTVLARLARQLAVPYVAAATGINVDADSGRARIGEHWIADGDALSVDGTAGEVFVGQLARHVPPPDENLARVLAWKETFARGRR